MRERLIAIIGRMWRSGPGAQVLMSLGVGLTLIYILSLFVSHDPVPQTAVQPRSGASFSTARPTIAPTATIIPSTTIASTATHTPWPTSTPQPTNTPKPTLVSFPSGGLGLDISVWEKTHTRTKKGVLGIIYDSIYEVINIDGRVEYIEYQQKNPLTPTEAQTLAQTFFPFDAQMIKTYSPPDRSETTVHLYYSAALAPRFEDKWWIGGDPGQFTLQYNVFKGQITRFIIATGNNP